MSTRLRTFVFVGMVAVGSAASWTASGQNQLPRRW